MPSPKRRYPSAPDPAAVSALVAQAIAEGRHSPATTFVCGKCYRDVETIHHITLGRVRLCRKCSVDGGCECERCRGVRARRLAEMAGRVP